MAFENLKQKTFTQATSSVNTKIKEIYRTIPAVLRDGIKSKDNHSIGIIREFNPHYSINHYFFK